MLIAPRSQRQRATVQPASAVALGGAELIAASATDVGSYRERRRQRRLLTLAAVLAPLLAFLWYRWADGRPFNIFALPHIDPLILLSLLIPVAIIGAVIAPQVLIGRSPHVLYRSQQLGTGLSDVVGIDAVRAEVVRSLNLFLAHRTYAETMGGRPRRGLLFEGAPGTGKTHLAKAMAAEAGVPFAFVSATAFQSMFYGATSRRIRSYFRSLRRIARREGGVIGFIEEIDAIAGARAGMTPVGQRFSRSVTTHPSGIASDTGAVVNELLVQLQSFDEPTGVQKAVGWLVEAANTFLPAHRQLAKPRPPQENVLLIAATNRADALDPALLRPGRLDRRLTFELPSKPDRRALVDYFLTKKAHEAELDDPDRRDALAALTAGWSPAAIEHVLDEALVNALRRGATGMNWRDVEQSRLVSEVGLGSPVTYTPAERRLIATHEAGHATVAHLVAPQRRLEVLTIVKRGPALGLLAHGDVDDVYTRSRSELCALIQIAMGGQVAEELFFGDVSTGPSGDLAHATKVAAQMVGAAGMAGQLVSFAAVTDTGLGGTDLVGKVLSDGPSRERVEQLLAEQKQVVRRLLAANRHLVEALRDALLEREELIGAEIGEVLASAGPAVLDVRESVADILVP